MNICNRLRGHGSILKDASNYEAQRRCLRNFLNDYVKVIERTQQFRNNCQLLAEIRLRARVMGTCTLYVRDITD